MSRSRPNDLSSWVVGSRPAAHEGSPGTELLEGLVALSYEGDSGASVINGAMVYVGATMY